MRPPTTPVPVDTSTQTPTSTSPETLRTRHSAEAYGFLHVATISSAHGLNGAVKVTTHTDFPSYRLSPTSPLPRYLLLPGRVYPRETTVVAARPASRDGVWIVHLSGVTSREAVRYKRLIGAHIYTRTAHLPPLARGEFVAASLVSLRVSQRLQNPDEEAVHYRADTKHGGAVEGGAPIGIVELVHSASSNARSAAARVANDVLQIALFTHPQLNNAAAFDLDRYDIPETAPRALIPFVKQIVPVVDITSAIIIIDPPPGLLEATTTTTPTTGRVARRRQTPRALLPPAATSSEDCDDGEGRVEKR